MNIAELVAYEKPYELELRNPITGEKMGIVFHIVSSDSKRVTDVLRDAQVSYLKERALNGERAQFPDVDSMAMAASIVDWTWGDNEFNHIKDGVPATEENTLHVIKHPNAVWIRNQVKAASDKIENFTQA